MTIKDSLAEFARKLGIAKGVLDKGSRSLADLESAVALVDRTLAEVDAQSADLRDKRLELLLTGDAAALADADARLHDCEINQERARALRDRLLAQTREIEEAERIAGLRQFGRERAKAINDAAEKMNRELKPAMKKMLELFAVMRAARSAFNQAHGKLERNRAAGIAELDVPWPEILADADHEFRALHTFYSLNN